MEKTIITIPTFYCYYGVAGFLVWFGWWGMSKIKRGVRIMSEARRLKKETRRREKEADELKQLAIYLPGAWLSIYQEIKGRIYYKVKLAGLENFLATNSPSSIPKLPIQGMDKIMRLFDNNREELYKAAGFLKPYARLACHNEPQPQPRQQAKTDPRQQAKADLTNIRKMFCTACGYTFLEDKSIEWGRCPHCLCSPDYLASCHKPSPILI